VADRSGGIIIVTALINWLSTAVRRDEEGQGLAEYALILALIAIVVIGAVIFLGGQINGIMSDVGTSI
jgi:pilus assembly protein Flp/PilA